MLISNRPAEPHVAAGVYLIPKSEHPAKEPTDKSMGLVRDRWTPRAQGASEPHGAGHVHSHSAEHRSPGVSASDLALVKDLIGVIKGLSADNADHHNDSAISKLVNVIEQVLKSDGGGAAKDALAPVLGRSSKVEPHGGGGDMGVTQRVGQGRLDKSAQGSIEPKSAPQNSPSVAIEPTPPNSPKTGARAEDRGDHDRLIHDIQVMLHYDPSKKEPISRPQAAQLATPSTTRAAEVKAQKESDDHASAMRGMGFQRVNDHWHLYGHTDRFDNK
jgi:hypothetical protein